MMLQQPRQVSQFDARKRIETLIIVADYVQTMLTTCIHDLKANRTIRSISGFIVRSYPLSMIFARGRWLPFRQILVADESGWVLVKVWGSRATELLRGQEIQLQKTFCFDRDGMLHLSLGIHSELKICTQA